jgi:mono/diheme cytochrome c family protein
MYPFLWWSGIVVAVLLMCLVIAVSSIYLVSGSRLGYAYQVEPAPVVIPVSEEAVATGRHIAITRGCVDCHGENLSGRVVMDDASFGRIVSANLTGGRGSRVNAFTEADWVRAIRHGIGPDNRGLVFMPSNEYFVLSDEDLGALIAYMKSVRPVHGESAVTRIGPVGRIRYLTGEVPLVAAELIDHDATPPPAPPYGPTPEYGGYLAVSCSGCHGADYTGGDIPGVPSDWPPAANLTPDPSGLGGWRQEDFARVLRTGQRPDGRQIDPAHMPWTFSRHFRDDEISALWRYFQSLEPRPMSDR